MYSQSDIFFGAERGFEGCSVTAGVIPRQSSAGQAAAECYLHSKIARERLRRVDVIFENPDGVGPSAFVLHLIAGLVDRFNASFPSLKNGFDSRIPLK